MLKKRYLFCLITLSSIATAQKLGSGDSFYQSRLCGLYHCDLVGNKREYGPTGGKLAYFQYKTDNPSVFIDVGRDVNSNTIQFLGAFSTDSKGDATKLFTDIVKAALPGTLFTLWNAIDCMEMAYLIPAKKHEQVYGDVRIGCAITNDYGGGYYFLRPTSKFK